MKNWANQETDKAKRTRRGYLCRMEIFHDLKSKYSGNLYALRWKGHGSPLQPSGEPGRWNGYGTDALYFADSVEACENELKDRWGDKYERNKYQLVTYKFEEETVLDAGKILGTSLLESRVGRGYEKTHELSSWARSNGYGVVQCASKVAHDLGSAGTCLIIYPDIFRLDPSKFNVE